MPEPQRVVISNATPIISLALIGKLDLLQQLYTNIMIPPAVQAEGRPAVSRSIVYSISGVW